VLLSVGVKYKFGMAPGASATRNSDRRLSGARMQLRDLALAHACASDATLLASNLWPPIKSRFTQAAIGITRSRDHGHRTAIRFTPRCSGHCRDGRPAIAAGVLFRAGIFQGISARRAGTASCDHHRRTCRETSLPADDLTAAPVAPTPLRGYSVPAGGFFKGHPGVARSGSTLSAFFLGISISARCSKSRERCASNEATVSRRIGRLTARLHKELIASLRASGMSARLPGRRWGRSTGY